MPFYVGCEHMTTSYIAHILCCFINSPSNKNGRVLRCCKFMSRPQIILHRAGVNSTCLRKSGSRFNCSRTQINLSTHNVRYYWGPHLVSWLSINQSFSDPAISSDSDLDWSPKFGLGLGLGLKKSWLSYTLTQNYQSMKYLWCFNYSRYLCMWFIKGIIGF
jgi:hypothetical protein